jgi:hypothetical protein
LIRDGREARTVVLKIVHDKIPDALRPFRVDLERHLRRQRSSLAVVAVIVTLHCWRHESTLLYQVLYPSCQGRIPDETRKLTPRSRSTKNQL